MVQGAEMHLILRNELRSMVQGAEIRLLRKFLMKGWNEKKTSEDDFL
jgi:hypothetical protein